MRKSTSAARGWYLFCLYFVIGGEKGRREATGGGQISHCKAYKDWHSLDAVLYLAT